MQRVTLALDPHDPTTWVAHDVEDVRAFLMEEFGEVFPHTGRIYHEQVSSLHDVTPADEDQIEALGQMPGPFFVVIYPGDPITLIIAVVAVVAVAATVFLIASIPSVPNAAARNTQSTSPNNELSNRSNQARPNGRIPDIFGQVTSTPDLIAVPYKVFVNNEELEVAYMAVGRGSYVIDNIRDDTTPIAEIAGASVEVYAPYTSPLTGNSAPQLTIGSAIDQDLVTVSRSNAVNGQVLDPPEGAAALNVYCTFKYPNIIEAEAAIESGYYDSSLGEWVTEYTPVDLTQYFEPGQQITITTTDYTETGLTVNVSGTYTISTVGTTTITLSSPAFINAAWNDLDTYTGDMTGSLYTTLARSGELWVGPFTLNLTGMEKVYANFVAVNGMYKDDGKNQYYTSVTVRLEITPINGFGVPTGAAETFDTTISGSAIDRETKAVTLKADPTFTGRCRIRAMRMTPKDTAFTGQVVDEVKWRDAYAVAPIAKQQFGDVTTVFSLTRATDGALAVKDRKLNLRATRRIRIGDQDTTNAYTFATTAEGWVPFQGYSSSVVSSGGKLVTTALAGAAYGAMVSIGDLIEGDTIEVTFTLSDYSSMTQVVVGLLQDNIGFVSGTFSLAAGTYTRTFTASVDMVGNGRLLFYAPEGTGSFALDNVTINRNGSEFSHTKRADLILFAVCRDKYIGNRTPAEVDYDNITASIDDAEDYFGTSDAVEFSYTFDNSNVSFEETVAIIAQAAFCTAYRRGSQIKLSFERETEDSTLLFNHRNKLPGTETRTVRFGYQNDIDGVEYTYVDPIDDAIVTKYLPEDQSAINPKKVDSIGVRAHRQAHFHINRIWNKLRYQNTTTEFQAIQQAEMLVRQDRILVADNTRSDTMDGEVLAQNVLELTLSQPVVITGGLDHTIFLQHTDGTVQAIDIASVGPVLANDTTKIVLSTAPSLPLATDAIDPDLRVRAGYEIVGNNASRSSAFLVAEREPQSNFTSTVTAINYDSRYYANDKDFVDGVID